MQLSAYLSSTTRCRPSPLGAEGLREALRAL
jgi:hypothetical protein